MGDDTLPWRESEYKLQAILEELDIDLRKKYLDDYFHRAEVAVDGSTVTLDYDPFVTKKVIEGGEEWYSVKSVEALDINTVRVTLSVER